MPEAGTGKMVFLIAFPDGLYLRQKLCKVTDSFFGQRYEIPYGGILMKIQELEKSIADLGQMVGQTRR
jgi:hypothetical protein